MHPPCYACAAPRHAPPSLFSARARSSALALLSAYTCKAHPPPFCVRLQDAPWPGQLVGLSGGFSWLNQYGSTLGAAWPPGNDYAAFSRIGDVYNVNTEVITDHHSRDGLVLEGMCCSVASLSARGVLRWTINPTLVCPVLFPPSVHCPGDGPRARRPVVAVGVSAAGRRPGTLAGSRWGPRGHPVHGPRA